MRCTMTTVHRKDIVMPDIIENEFDYAIEFDTSKFFKPAELHVIEDIFFNEEIKITSNFQDEIREETSIEYHEEISEEISYSEIFDLSTISPGEIEIEDEIKMSYLWQKYCTMSK